MTATTVIESVKNVNPEPRQLNNNCTVPTTKAPHENRIKFMIAITEAEQPGYVSAAKTPLRNRTAVALNAIKNCRTSGTAIDGERKENP
jgi:hypothetical protein